MPSPLFRFISRFIFHTLSARYDMIAIRFRVDAVRCFDGAMPRRALCRYAAPARCC